jgi:putative DNA primase/helicase
LTSPTGEKISQEKIDNLHTLGFKLVPIAADGFTPCVSWSDIYENGWNESELSNTKFCNVATCFGKSHIKDENDQDLYLNCLDIDSKEVYDRLCIVLDTDKNERFLISQLRKLTYVTKTRKEFGLHIYWLSHKLNMPVHRNNCKPGYEFEIKTNESGALAALPESRHRDDINFRYTSIGQNKIVTNDQLYGEIVRILDDCIIKERTPQSHNSAPASRQLNEMEVREITDLLSDLYIVGFRNEICYLISGILYKNGIGLETASRIINELARHDDELKSRLNVMRRTYLKEVGEVSGRKQLLKTLKAVCNDDKQALEILLSILKILNPSLYESTKIEHNRIAQELIQEYHFKTMEDTEELYSYDDTTGRYSNQGEVLVRKELEILFPEISTRNVNEILQKIQRKNPVARAEFDSSILTNVENGLLNPLTGELIPHSPKILTLNQLPIKFDRTAKCPRIQSFLSQVLRPCDIFTLLQFLGYCLLRNSKYEKSLILVGLGDNGKSVLLKLIDTFLGFDNVSHVSLKELSDDKFSKADLFGKMANVSYDLESGKIQDISAFKQLVSGDSVRAQRKNQDAFYFRNYAKLIFSSNQVPRVVDSGYPWQKRIIPIPLLETFDDNKDINLIDKLTSSEELSGLLNLALIGLRQLIKDGQFAHVEDIRTINQLFEENEKVVVDFTLECCFRDPSSSELSEKVYQSYSQYCKKKGENPLSYNSFGVYFLKQTGIKKGRIMIEGIRNYTYRGIKLKRT